VTGVQTCALPICVRVGQHSCRVVTETCSVRVGQHSCRVMTEMFRGDLCRSAGLFAAVSGIESRTVFGNVEQEERD
jgi:hypothetical protein